MNHDLTQLQLSWLSKLHAARVNLEGSYKKHRSYPKWVIECVGCFVEFTTDDPVHAIRFIKEHSGHKMQVEQNQFPNAINYNREQTLQDLAKLGQHMVSVEADGQVLAQMRITYQFIASGGSIPGGIQRLTEYFLVTRDGVCVTQEYQREWLMAIYNNDRQFITNIPKYFEVRE